MKQPRLVAAMFTIALVAAFVMNVASFAATTTRLVPVFAENVPGAFGSSWTSELRVYNGSDQPQTVRTTRIFPMAGSDCSGLSDVELPPRVAGGIRSIGCRGSGAAAIEIETDSSVDLSSAITNVGGTEQTLCGLSGYTESIPVLDLASAYATHQTLAPVVAYYSALPTVRHNLGIVNPNAAPIVVALRYFDFAGIAIVRSDWPTQVTVPANTLVQVNDFMPPPQIIITPPVA